MRGDDEVEQATIQRPWQRQRPRRVVGWGIGLVLTVAATFIVGELGDKTMLVTFGLAASQGPLPTWIGATIGEVAANLVVVPSAAASGRGCRPRTVRMVSAALFILGGVAVLAGALLGGD